MAEKVKAVPPGFHTLTPHLTVRDADKALQFYKNAFGAEIGGVARMPDGKVMHAALRIGDSMLMLNEEMPEYGGLSRSRSMAQALLSTFIRTMLTRHLTARFPPELR